MEVGGNKGVNRVAIARDFGDRRGLYGLPRPVGILGWKEGMAKDKARQSENSNICYPYASGHGSGEDFVDDLAEDVGETFWVSPVVVGEAGMVNTKDMEESGVEVVDVDFSVFRPKANWIRASVGHTPFDRPARKDDGITPGIVVPASPLLAHGHTAEFAAPDDEGILPKATGF